MICQINRWKINGSITCLPSVSGSIRVSHPAMNAPAPKTMGDKSPRSKMYGARIVPNLRIKIGLYNLVSKKWIRINLMAYLLTT